MCTIKVIYNDYVNHTGMDPSFGKVGKVVRQGSREHVLLLQWVQEQSRGIGICRKKSPEAGNLLQIRLCTLNKPVFCQLIIRPHRRRFYMVMGGGGGVRPTPTNPLDSTLPCDSLIQVQPGNTCPEAIQVVTEWDVTSCGTQVFKRRSSVFSTATTPLSDPRRNRLAEFCL